MSLSNLTGKKEDSLFIIESFKAKNISGNQDDNQSGITAGHVLLPTRREISALSDRGDSDKYESHNDRLARIEKEAYEKGFAQGQKDGLALEQRQIEEKGRHLENLFQGLQRLKDQIYSESEGELLKLSKLMAKKIIRREIEIDPAVISRTIQSTFRFLTGKSRLKIMITPDDMEEVKRILPDLAAITKGGQYQLIEDKAIERGGCILETGFGRINATIDDQMGELEKEIEKEFLSNQGNSSADKS